MSHHDQKNPDCGQCGGPYAPPPPLGKGGASGYAIRPDGRRICYACAAENEHADMIKDGKTVLYLVPARQGDPQAYRWRVINWTGHLEFRTIATPRKLRHPWGINDIIAYFNGPDGHVWSARRRGDMTLCRCRRLKERWRA